MEMSTDDQRTKPPETGDEEASETTRDAARGGEDTNPARATQPIDGSDQHPGQTETPPEEEDVGVPEELEDRTD
jgi:hypothetical protein